MEQLSGRCRGHQGRPGQARTKIEPSMANQILLPPPGWSLLNREAWCFRAAMLFQPSWQHDNQFSSETNTARSPFRSARTLSYCHSHHFLCMANSACTDEVTHQHGFSLYDFNQTISVFNIFHFLTCLLLCTDRVWHLIHVASLQRSIFLCADRDILDVCLAAWNTLWRALRSTQCRQWKCRMSDLYVQLCRIDVCKCAF